MEHIFAIAIIIFLLAILVISAYSSHYKFWSKNILLLIPAFFLGNQIVGIWLDFWAYRLVVGFVLGILLFVLISTLFNLIVMLKDRYFGSDGPSNLENFDQRSQDED